MNLKRVILITTTLLLAVALSGCGEAGNQLDFEDYCALKDIFEKQYYDLYLENDSFSDELTEYYTAEYKPIGDYSEEELKSEYDRSLKIAEEAKKHGIAYDDNMDLFYEYANAFFMDNPFTGEASYPVIKAGIVQTIAEKGISSKEYIETALVPYLILTQARDDLLVYYYGNIYGGSFEMLDYSNVKDEETLKAYAELEQTHEYQTQYIEFLREYDEYTKKL